MKLYDECGIAAVTNSHCCGIILGFSGLRGFKFINKNSVINQPRHSATKSIYVTCVDLLCVSSTQIYEIEKYKHIKNVIRPS